MLTLLRPGLEPLEVEFLFLDFEGTLASDGRINPKAKDKINLLSKRMGIRIFVKGNHGLPEKTFRKMKAEVVYLTGGSFAKQKLGRLQEVGPGRSVVIGNGLDDGLVIEAAGFGICVIGREGASGEAVRKADLVVTSILDAFDFLLKPLRQKATLEG
jgi:soluble P-type ATPase